MILVYKNDAKLKQKQPVKTSTHICVFKKRIRKIRRKQTPGGRETERQGLYQPAVDVKMLMDSGLI